MINLDCPKCGYPLEYQPMPNRYKFKCTECNREFTERTSDDYVGEAVRNFWKSNNYAFPVVAFFYQKYKFETQWERCTELINCDSDTDLKTVIFENDFCEGQQDIKNIHIVSLEEVFEFYFDKHEKHLAKGV